MIRFEVLAMKIHLEQVIDAIETADDAFTYFFDTQTGETVFLQDEIAIGERNEELENSIENAPSGRFLRFPTKFDIHEYSIMESFVESLPPGVARQELAYAIRGRGAFRRFKNGIYFHRIEQQWFEYRDHAVREIAIHWCRDVGIEYEE